MCVTSLVPKPHMGVRLGVWHTSLQHGHTYKQPIVYCLWCIVCGWAAMLKWHLPWLIPSFIRCYPQWIIHCIVLGHLRGCELWLCVLIWSKERDNQGKYTLSTVPWDVLCQLFCEFKSCLIATSLWQNCLLLLLLLGMCLINIVKYLLTNFVKHCLSEDVV